MEPDQDQAFIAFNKETAVEVEQATASGRKIQRIYNGATGIMVVDPGKLGELKNFVIENHGLMVYGNPKDLLGLNGGNTTGAASAKNGRLSEGSSQIQQDENTPTDMTAEAYPSPLKDPNRSQRQDLQYDVCYTGQASKEDVQRHQEWHRIYTFCTPSPPGQQFHQAENLDTYTREAHLGCHLCKLAFSSKEEVDDHLLRLHYECELCHVFYSTSYQALQIHGEHDHPKCSMCGKHSIRFQSDADLKRHKDIHHSLCDLCLRHFKNERHLKTHRVSEHPKCGICPGLGRFGSISALHEHTRDTHRDSSRSHNHVDSRRKHHHK